MGKSGEGREFCVKEEQVKKCVDSGIVCVGWGSLGQVRKCRQGREVYIR